MNIARILSISRPRFWLYEFGTFVLGLLVAYIYISEVVVGWEVVLFGLYFLIPANILIYGINDIFDYETDSKNPKKLEYEDILPPKQHKAVYCWIVLTSLPFVIAAFFTNSAALLAFLLFIFFATFYSANPIRAKARPILDSFFSASHYVITGVFGYLLITASWASVNWWLVLAPILWAMAMHAYSAVPDIKADGDSDLDTVATMLGKKWTLILCAVAYFTAFCIVCCVTGEWWFILLSIPYVALCLYSIKTSESQLFRLYTYFPYLNAAIGVIVTIYLLSMLIR